MSTTGESMLAAPPPPGGPWPRRLSIPRVGPVAGTVEVPSSKSLSHRALNLALLAGRATRLERLLRAEDTELFLAVLGALGWRVVTDDGGVDLEPPLGEARRPAEDVELECGNAGTLYRFLVATLCTQAGRFRVNGTARLRERPIGVLVDALRSLGAEIRYLEREGYAPLEITGPSLRGGAAALDASESSQYLSALLMAGLRAAGPLDLDVVSLASAPYVDITLQCLRALGLDAAVEVQGSHYRVTPAADFGAAVTVVEGDWSAAAYPAAAAAVTGGRVRLRGLRRDSAQGDRRFVEILVSMGARAEWHDDELEVVGGPLEAPGEVDLGDIPDQVPTLAVVAAAARGETRIVGVPHLRIKESDRLSAMATELARAGVEVSEQPAGLAVVGREWSEAPAVTVESWNDHRIAMSLAVLGLVRGALVIDSPQVVCKSYPGFFEDLAGLCPIPTTEDETGA